MIFFKNKRGGGCTLSHSFFLSSFSSSSTCKLPIYCLSTYLYFIYLCVVRYADKHRVFFRSFLCLCLLIRFVALCGFIFAFTAFLRLFLFLHQPTPHPYFTIQNRWLPHSLIFLFFNFQNFFVEKMWYDLFTFRVCLCRYEMFTY